MENKKGDERAASIDIKDQQQTLQKESKEKGSKERKRNLKANESTNG